MVGVVRLDSSGVQEILKSAGVRAVVDDLAAQVAANVSTDKPVEVRSYTTDRAAASVSIAHPAGMATQARDGALTKAATSVGLEVTER